MNEEEMMEVTETETVETEVVETETMNATVTEPGFVDKAKGIAKDVVDKVTAFVTENKDKAIMFGGIAVAAVVVLILLGSVVLKSDRYDRDVDYKYMYDYLDDDVLVNVEGKTIECDEDIYDCDWSADGSLSVMIDEDWTLWVVKGKKLVQVDEDVENYWVSIYGDTIAYMKDNKDGVADLFLYTVKGGKIKEISTDASVWFDVKLSPDGKSVLFTEVNKKGTATLMVSKNGKEPEEIEKNASAIGVSDNAKYVYYMVDSKLYVNDEKIETKEYVNSIYFNADMTEVLYQAGSTAKYYMAKKGESVKLKNGYLSGIVVPSDVVYGNAVYGIDTFDKSVIKLAGGLYYMHGKGEKLEKITSGYDSCRMSEDGKSLLYVENGNLVYIKNVAKPEKEEKIKKLEIDTLLASKDLKTVYFINYDDELCYLKKDEGVVIAKDIYRATYSDKFGVVYFLDEDELCYAGKTKKSVETITDDASYLSKSGNYITFDLDEEEPCVMTGKKKFINLED